MTSLLKRDYLSLMYETVSSLVYIKQALLPSTSLEEEIKIK